MSDFPKQAQRSFSERLASISRSASALRASIGRRLVSAQESGTSQGARASAQIPDREANAPEGLCLYAVGDVHGRRDLLETLIATIREDAAGLPEGTQPQVIFLGDYIDRGLQSREVIEYFISGALDDLDPVFLMGNHEEAILRFLSDANFGHQWAQYGGAETLFSYGFQTPNQRASLGSHDAMSAARNAWQRLWDEFRIRLPESHRAFFESLAPYHIAGDYVFVHAGLRPGIDIEQQSQRDMLWIREEFLEDRSLFSHVVVHGHTPEEKIHRDSRRIGLDTGAFLSGRLSAARLCGTEVAFLST